MLHDWEDDECVCILQTVRAACAEGRLLVIEQVVGDPNTDARAKFADLNMLVMPGGRERTAAEWKSLFNSAGFELTAIVPSAVGWCVIEGAAVRP